VSPVEPGLAFVQGPGKGKVRDSLVCTANLQGDNAISPNVQGRVRLDRWDLLVCLLVWATLLYFNRMRERIATASDIERVKREVDRVHTLSTALTYLHMDIP
jgi:hypothetical protein